MAESLKGYVALITGGSSGMGFEMAKQLLSQGATVIVAARSGEKLDGAKKRLSVFGDAHAVAMDVANEDSVVEAARWVEDTFDHLDMVVNNAGIGSNAPGMKDLPANHHFYDIPVSAARAIVDTNLIGFFIVARTFVPIVMKQGHGSLVYVSTSTETMTRPGQLPYGPSKAGAEAMATIMAEELRGTGVMVNVICPGGFTDTGMAGEGAKDFFLKNDMPILQPTVMNKAISFLASSASTGISGEKLIGKDMDAWLEAKGIEFNV